MKVKYEQFKYWLKWKMHEYVKQLAYLFVYGIFLSMALVTTYLVS